LHFAEGDTAAQRGKGDVMLDPAKLENVRHRGAKIEARCPACAELGADKTGNHLFIAEAGKFGCIAAPGPDGSAHRKLIWKLAGDGNAVARPLPVARPKPKTKPLPLLPALRPLCIEEMGQVARLRGWSAFAGLQLLANRGMLWHGKVWDGGSEWPAWIITDSTRRNAQARRYDGQNWQGIGAKAKTLKRSDASWPIGAANIKGAGVLLCEGQPDFCAALLVSWWEGANVSPVCMTGAGNSIPPDALPYFDGKHIRIAAHDDDSGREAGKRWARQLWEAGAAAVDRFNFSGLIRPDGRPVNDLADYAQLLSTEMAPAPKVLSGIAV